MSMKKYKTDPKRLSSDRPLRSRETYEDNFDDYSWHLLVRIAGETHHVVVEVQVASVDQGRHHDPGPLLVEHDGVGVQAHAQDRVRVEACAD